MGPLKIIAGVTFALIILLGCVVMATAALDTFAEMTGIAWLSEASLIWVLILCLVLMPAKFRALPISFTRRGSIEINAPLSDVWPRVQPRPGNPYHGQIFTRIENVPDRSDEVLLHVDDRFSAGDAPLALHVRLTEEIPEHKISMTYLNADKLPLFSSDVSLSETFLEPAGDGRSRVTFVEHLDRFRPSSILLFVHLNPAQDAAIRLKAMCEGKEDKSWMGRMYREVGADGEPSEELQGKIRLAGTTAVVAATFMIAVVLWLIARVSAGQ